MLFRSDRHHEASARTEKGRIAAELSDYLAAGYAHVHHEDGRRDWHHVVWIMEFYQVPLTRRDAAGKRQARISLVQGW